MAFPPGTTFYEAGSDSDRSPDSGIDFDQGSQYESGSETERSPNSDYGSDSETERSPGSDYGSDYGSEAEEEDFGEQEEEEEVSDSDYATPSPEPAVILPWNVSVPEPVPGQVAPWQGSLPEPVAPWQETLPETLQETLQEDQADFSTLDPEPDIEPDPQPELTEADVLDLQQELLQEIAQAPVVNPYWDQYKESAWAAPAAPKVPSTSETHTIPEPTQDQGETLYVFSFRLELFRLMRSMPEYRYRSNLDALCRAATNVICHRMGYSRALMEDLHPVLTRIGVKISRAS